MITGFLLLLGAYLLGSIPTGPILATLYADVDLASRGSGNIGATNANRILGRRFGIATLVGDLLKGALPVAVATVLSGESITLPGMVALAAFVGHCWPVYLEFKGGKGVATAAGSLLVLAPVVTLLTAATWMLLLLAFKRPSVSALAATVTMTGFTAVIRPDLIWVAAALAIGLFFRHRDNIDRLLAGEEPPSSLG